MNEAFSETLAALRSESGLTQEEVANHLGITKAAVSKWECGQNMPDIALLPAIAQLYAVSIDDLFEGSEELDQERIDVAYLKALELFSAGFPLGLEYVKEQVRLHWSNALLLRKMGLALFAQIPSLSGYEGTSVSEDALVCAQEVERLFRRVIELDPAGASVQVDIAPLTRVLLWMGRSEEAEELIESCVAKEPNLSTISLAQIYRESSRADEAEIVLQRGLLLSLLEVEAIMTAMASQDGIEQLEELVGLAETLQPNTAYISLFPTLMPSLRLEQSRRHVAAGKNEQAIDTLTLFANALDAACDAMLHPKSPALFDKVPDMLWQEADGQIDSARADAVDGLRAAYANTLMSEDVWDSIRSNERFQALLSRIGSSKDMRAI